MAGGLSYFITDRSLPKSRLLSPQQPRTQTRTWTRTASGYALQRLHCDWIRIFLQVSNPTAGLYIFQISYALGIGQQATLNFVAGESGIGAGTAHIWIDIDSEAQYPRAAVCNTSIHVLDNLHASLQTMSALPRAQQMNVNRVYVSPSYFWAYQSLANDATPDHHTTSKPQIPQPEDTTSYTRSDEDRTGCDCVVSQNTTGLR